MLVDRHCLQGTQNGPQHEPETQGNLQKGTQSTEAVQTKKLQNNEYFFPKDLIYLLLEGGKSGTETPMCKRYTNWLPLARPQLETWPATQVCALTGNQTFGSQVGAQSTEPHQPGHNEYSYINKRKYSFQNWMPPKKAHKDSKKALKL